MTTFVLAVGVFAVLVGALTLLILALSYRSKTRYAPRSGPDLHPAWLYRDTAGTVYSSRNHSQS
jgi:hypothetical protein